MRWQDSVTPELQRIINDVARLRKTRVIVGVLGDEDSHMVKVARVHEYGATIRPKNAKSLAIPLSPKARGKSPRDFKETWIFDNDEHSFIVRDLSGGRFEFLYLLLSSVTIPERSFIRAGYDANKDRLFRLYNNLMLALVEGKLTAEQVANQLGMYAVKYIQEFMPTVMPPKSDITKAADPDSADTVLNSSGRLSDSIEYEVIGL